MNVQEYLLQCKVKSVSRLTDKQVCNYFVNENVGERQSDAAQFAINMAGRTMFGEKISKSKVMASLRKSMTTGRIFSIHFVEREGVYSADELPLKGDYGWVYEP